MQCAHTILMVRPAAFGFNTETAADNFFQHQGRASSDEVHYCAVKEFDAMVEGLRLAGIEVVVVEDTAQPVKPDAIFPNNWFNTTPDGALNIFPMFASNRREEKRDDILQMLSKDYQVKDAWDWTEFEADYKFLEGTGSVVIDHVNRFVYASISERTHPAVLEKFSAANGYKAIIFKGFDEQARPLYHTNVMMSIGDRFAVLCPKAIEDDTERIAVAQLLETTGHENIYISPEQLQSFCGNILQLKNKEGKAFIIMSQRAFDSFTLSQRERLERHGTLLAFDVSTIEQVAGGSVRCMIAELFLTPTLTN
ncbi:MAG TPA: arginine deiminase-related protein [Flavisolibacter sp.]|nr:arginine deiminase-related protein [Flavisolibacter sp.]